MFRPGFIGVSYFWLYPAFYFRCIFAIRLELKLPRVPGYGYLSPGAVSLAVNRNQTGADPNANLLVINDKSVPSPADPYGIKESDPYTSKAEAVYSDELYSEASPFKNDALPGIDVVVNEQWLTTRGQPSGEIGRYTGGAEKNRPGFVTSGWRSLENPCGQEPAPVFRKKSQKPNGIIWWQWEDIKCADVKEGQNVDLDNDYIEEIVVQIYKTDPVIDEFGNIISEGKTYWYITDPKLADINPEYGKPDPNRKAIVPYQKTVELPDGTKTEAIVSQGLQPAYTKNSYIPEYKHNKDTDRWEGTYIERTETEKGINIKEAVDNKETITRTIMLNQKGTLTPPENQIERPGAK